MRIERAVCAVAATLCLAACGGGSGGSNADGFANDAPTPIPTPAPTPSPTPTTVYEPAVDFSQDFGWLVYAAESYTTIPWMNGEPQDEQREVGVRYFEGTNRVAFRYTASDESARLNFDNTEYSWPSEDLLKQSNGTAYNWRTLSNLGAREVSDSITVAGSGDYAFAARQELRISPDFIMIVPQTEEYKRILMGGPHTRVDEFPLDREQYRLSFATDIGTGSEDIVIDFAQERIEATITINEAVPEGEPENSIQITIRGDFDPEINRVNGTLASSDGSYSGNFAGAFIGPLADTFVAVTAINTTRDDRHAGIGTINATRTYARVFLNSPS